MRHSYGISAAAALLLAMPAPAPAQSGIEVKGGFSYGNVSNRGLLPGALRERTGFAVGVGVGVSRNLLAFGAEALYAQRGVESSSEPDSSRKLDYVDVPLYVRAALPLASVTPFAYAGPQLSFEVRCRSGDAACPDTDRPMTSYAAVIGGGVRLGKPGGFSLEGRYVYGLTDLKLSTVTSADSYQTRSFLILGGFAF